MFTHGVPIAGFTMAAPPPPHPRPDMASAERFIVIYSFHPSTLFWAAFACAVSITVGQKPEEVCVKLPDGKNITWPECQQQMNNFVDFDGDDKDDGDLNTVFNGTSPMIWLSITEESLKNFSRWVVLKQTHLI